ncbi:hypothetical protein Aperf_G00000030465 [Anoplocephala perfoliata]
MDQTEQSPDEHLPVLAVIKSIFDDFGLTDLDESVYLHVMDIISTYTGELLNDAKYNALAAGRSQINEQDIELAIENKSEELVFAPLHKNMLLEYAEKVNSQPLPPIKPCSGLKLAPDKYTTTAPNYTIATDSGANMLNAPVSMNVPPRLVMPNSNPTASPSSLALYRVSNVPGAPSQGQRPTLIPGPTANSGNMVDLSGSGIHVLGAQSASSSLIRVHSSNFVQPSQPTIGGALPNSANTASNLLRKFGEE